MLPTFHLFDGNLDTCNLGIDVGDLIIDTLLKNQSCLSLIDGSLVDSYGDDA
jgi:hypothetical protein